MGPLMDGCIKFPSELQVKAMHVDMHSGFWGDVVLACMIVVMPLLSGVSLCWTGLLGTECSSSEETDSELEKHTFAMSDVAKLAASWRANSWRRSSASEGFMFCSGEHFALVADRLLTRSSWTDLRAAV